MTNKDRLDEQIECAIREKGAIEHFRSIEAMERARSEKARRARRSWPAYRWAYAASVAVFLCAGGISLKESSDARSAYECYISEDTSVIRAGEAPMDMDAIDSRILELEAEIADPSNPEAEYMDQLLFDRQTMEFRKALEYLRKGRFISARRQLKDIIASGGAYAEDSSRILKTL